MNMLDIAATLTAWERLTSMARLIKATPGLNLSHVRSIGMDAAVREALPALRSAVEILHMPSSKDALDRLEARNASVAPFDEILSMIGVLEILFPRELANKCVLVVDAAHASYYTERQPFGAEVAAKFKTAVYDIEEVSRCYALGRTTASVCHAMRVMEVGLNAVFNCLSVPGSAPKNWGDALKRISAEVDRRRKTQGFDAAFFDEVHVTLDSVRAAWRNPAMHVERTYTDSEALDILGTIRRFMQTLASRMDENGDPKA